MFAVHVLYIFVRCVSICCILFLHFLGDGAGVRVGGVLFDCDRGGWPVCNDELEQLDHAGMHDVAGAVGTADS